MAPGQNRRRLVAALAAGAALLVALVALQLVDDGRDRPRTESVRIERAEVSRTAVHGTS